MGKECKFKRAEKNECSKTDELQKNKQTNKKMKIK